MTIIIPDERDLESGIVLHYRSLLDIDYKPKPVLQSNLRVLNSKLMAEINSTHVLCVVPWYFGSI